MIRDILIYPIMDFSKETHPQCPFLYTLLLNYIPPPIYLLTFLIPVISFKLSITRTFFDYPKRFELSGVSCIMQI